MPTFKLLVGRHSVGSGLNRKIYDAGKNNIVVSAGDLCKFNRPGTPAKFRKISDEDLTSKDPTVQAAVNDTKPAGPAPEDTLNSMTVPDLRKLAEEEEIDLSGARTKEEIMEKIRRAAG